MKQQRETFGVKAEGTTGHSKKTLGSGREERGRG